MFILRQRENAHARVPVCASGGGAEGERERERERERENISSRLCAEQHQLDSGLSPTNHESIT